MKLFSRLILTASLTCATPLWGQPATAPQTLQGVETAQFNLGKLLPSDSIQIYMEYPEFVALSAKERDELSAQGFVPDSEMRFHVTRTVSRGETLADVVFTPVVLRDGKWMKVRNYELKVRTLSPLKGIYHKVAALQTKAEQRTRYAAHSVLAQGKWVKIRVEKEGLYQLTDQQLRDMGFADPTRVKLYGYGGRLLPDVLKFTGKDAVIDDLNEVPLYRRKGSVLFFAEGLTTWNEDGSFLTNTFSSHSYYFLTEGEQPAPFPTLEAPASTAQTVNTVKAFTKFDNDAFVWYGGGRDFYDSKDLIDGPKFKLSLPGHTGGKCKVYYDLSAQSTTNRIAFTITQGSNSKRVATGQLNITQTGETARGYQHSFTTELESEETFTVKTAYTGRLNYLSTTYPQHLSTAYTTAPFTTTESAAVRLEVASADAHTQVWRLGNAEETVAALPGSLNGSTYTAQAPTGKDRFIVVNTEGSYPAPEVVGEIANQDLHADSCLDYVIIVPASGKLTAEAERLAEAHRNHSKLRIKVVRADQLYNEFSSGTPDASAYRRYLKMLYDRAQRPEDAPRYLLLFGDCSYDNRMITSDWKGTSPDDYLLAFERHYKDLYSSTEYTIGTLHSFVTDDFYGLLDDEEGKRMTVEKIDLGIGRFVCHTEDKAKWLVDQTLRYLRNENPGIWKNRMWAIADVGDDNLHMNDAQEVANTVKKSANANFLLRRLYPDVYTPTLTAKGLTYPEATEKIKTLVKQGSLIFNYNGHGSPDRISHKFFYTKEQMYENVGKAQPVWVFASCEITPYDQAIDDIGRNALFAPEGPAVAVVCAARSVFANYNRSLNMGFMEFALGKDAAGNRHSLGEALRLTKCELINNTGLPIGTDQTINKLKYILMGDPALCLSYPDPGIRIDSINGEAIKGTGMTELRIGQKVRLTGYVNADAMATTPDTSYDGTLSGTVFAPSQRITCKGQDNKGGKRLSFTDYTQTLFEGTVEVKAGRFALEFIVPRGIAFQQKEGLLSLYAVKKDGTSELNGSFKQFCFYGTADVTQTDTLGPDVYLYLNTPDFASGAKVNASPTFYAAINDSSGISLLSGNLGHDMEMWLDNDPSTTRTLNDFFSFDYGSYSKGLVSYPMEGLTPGRHRVTFRVWDVFDNATTTSLDFVVGDQAEPKFEVISSVDVPSVATNLVTTLAGPEEADTQITTEVYNTHGMRVWHRTLKVPAGNRYVSTVWNLTDYAGNRLEPGVYFYRSKKGGKETSTRRLLIQ